jgi:hypothetical protein
MSGILLVARACMTLLGPMTGTGATGNVTATSTSGTVTIPKNSYAYAVVNGERSKHVLLKTTAATSVGTGGTSVPVKAIFGATAGNLATGATVYWDPPLTSISSTATVASPGLSGASPATGRTSVKEVRFYENPDAAMNSEIMRSGLGRFPAILLAWEGTSDRDEMGKLKNVVEEAYVLFAIASRKDSDDARRSEGLDVLEEARERLFRREACDGSVFSSPAPLLIRRCGLKAKSAEHYVYYCRFTVDRSITRREPSDAAGWTGWADWDPTNIDMTTDSDEETELTILDDVKVDMTP